VSVPAGTRVTTAAIHGPRWSARADDWAALAAGISQPAWEAVVEATGIREGTRLLDVACGSGELCRLAASRGAIASGIDAAAGLIQVARRLGTNLDLRVGSMEELPWEDASFDVVTGFNAFQFAADFVGALAEARRVTRPGGRVAVCNWGRPEDNRLFEVMRPLRDLHPPTGRPATEPPATGDPGVLEGLARDAGLQPLLADEVDAPFEAADDERLVRALLSPGNAVAAVDHSGEDVVGTAILAAAAPFRRPDGSYRIENRFRYVICAA
jgi:SAM-dependent methyltransferase